MKSVIRDVYRLLLRCSANTNPVLPFNATRVVNFCFFFLICARYTNVRVNVSRQSVENTIRRTARGASQHSQNLMRI